MVLWTRSSDWLNISDSIICPQIRHHFFSDEQSWMCPGKLQFALNLNFGLCLAHIMTFIVFFCHFEAKKLNVLINISYIKKNGQDILQKLTCCVAQNIQDIHKWSSFAFGRRKKSCKFEMTWSENNTSTQHFLFFCFFFVVSQCFTDILHRYKNISPR